MKKYYSIGIDFGSLSGRALIVDLQSGKELCTSVFEYPHKIMDERLPGGKILDVDSALQHPQDYLDVFKNTVPQVLKDANVNPEDVVGVGIDFTSCTILPVLNDGTPLCFLDEFKDEPNAFVKLWKHHAAQKQADRINELASEMNEEWILRYGGKISSEWMFPKILQILEESPEIYRKADRFIEAADWVVWMLTGKETHNSCAAGYKALWSKQEGYPSKKFFKAVNPEMEDIIGTKVSKDITPIGSKAGEINAVGAGLTGLCEGTAVSAGIIDAHVALPAVGISDTAKMLMIMGTSTCHILMGDSQQIVPGMCGVVEDGVLPGYFGYEAGQSCVGDHFDWFAGNCVPHDYSEQAKSQNISIHKFLREKAKLLKAGESGLLALDWWNGNRSVLVDADLTGMMLGMTLQTKPEEMYRALLEATAFGTRIIIENFEENGIEIDELYAAGGIAEKDELMMQIYADVTNRQIKIAASPQAPALGSAIFGAVASGYFKNIKDAVQVMGKLKDTIYKPIPENVAVYDKYYKEYKILHDYFGRGANDVMKRLKLYKKETHK